MPFPSAPTEVWRGCLGGGSSRVSPSVDKAGLRIIEDRAVRGSAVGSLLPSAVPKAERHRVDPLTSPMNGGARARAADLLPQKAKEYPMVG